MAQLIEPQFHAGELAAQRRAGVAPRASAIRDAMPDQHRLFFAGLPFVLVATVDEAGWPLATMLAGAPGFVASPNANTLNIEALPQADDPLSRWLRSGTPIGILGIDLATRRRNRANGLVAGVDMDGFTVSVRESFGNCPQYIHVRDVAFERSIAQPIQTLEVLDAAAHAAIIAADTLFVATSGRDKGVDISHRAGKPGFVQIDGNTLTIPDYGGNRYFNTLGNLLLDSRAALLFLNFANGDLLLVQGRTEIVWDIPPEERTHGAERLWRLTVNRAWRRRAAVPLRWMWRAMSTCAD
jgi:predicted pyridoxine 5'-phosphate oxidase superfamily flavin-nucleotide-binding protein